MSTQSSLEAAFDEWMIVERITGYVRQHRFHPEREWALDVAWPEYHFGIELDGLTRWGTVRRKKDGREVIALGGHQSADGIIRDAEKMAHAILLGWTILRVPGPWVADGDRRIWNPLVLQVIRTYVP